MARKHENPKNPKNPENLKMTKNDENRPKNDHFLSRCWLRFNVPEAEKWPKGGPKTGIWVKKGLRASKTVKMTVFAKIAKKGVSDFGGPAFQNWLTFGTPFASESYLNLETGVSKSMTTFSGVVWVFDQNRSGSDLDDSYSGWCKKTCFFENRSKSTWPKNHEKVEKTCFWRFLTGLVQKLTHFLTPFWSQIV